MSPSQITSRHRDDESTPAKVSMKGFSLSKDSTNKPISLSIGRATKPQPQSSLGKRPRSALHHDSDSDSERERRAPRHEVITAFDANGAVAARNGASTEGTGPLVIPRMKNRDWREEIRRGRRGAGNGRNLLPPEVQAQRARQGQEPGQGLVANGEVADVVNAQGKEPQWGLSITTRAVVGEGSGVEMVQAAHDGTGTIESIVVTTESPAEARPEKTEDERAIEALMGIESRANRPDLVIPATAVVVANDDDEAYSTSAMPLTETDAYRRAILAAPDVSTLDDYDRVPVEEFGAALLRGMGWKEDDVGKRGRVERPKEVKRRQNLLGLGASELKGAEELGAWVQKSDPKRLGRGAGKGGPGERRPRPNEYREREDRKRESRDERYGGGHHRESGRDRHDYRDRSGYDSRR